MLANVSGVALHSSKGLYQSSGKEKESCCLVFPSTTKREFRHFHVVVVKRRQRNAHKKHVQSCCFANLNPLSFYRSRCRRHRRCLSSLIKDLGSRLPFGVNYVTKCSQLSFTVYYLLISSFRSVLSRRIVLGSFYLLIFYFEKFSTWIWRLPFAVNLTLNLSNV